MSELPIHLAGVTMQLGIDKAGKKYVGTRWDRGEISKATKRSFLQALRLFADAVGEKNLSEITRSDVERWLAEETKRCSANTVRLRLSTVRGMFHWAILEGFARRDPTLGIRGPKKPHSVPRYIADAELVLGQVRDARDRLIILLMLEEGLRAGGVASLELGDIDLVSGSLVVTEKGGRPRVLPVTKNVRLAIEDYLKQRGRQSGPLIQSYRDPGHGISSGQVSRIAGSTIKRADIEESGHALRHTFAHDMVDAGANLRTVQTALGHSSLMTTQIYLGFAEVRELRGFMGRRQVAREEQIEDGGAA